MESGEVEEMEVEGVTYYIKVDEEEEIFYNKKMKRIGKWSDRLDKISFISKKFREEHESQRDPTKKFFTSE